MEQVAHAGKAIMNDRKVTMKRPYKPEKRSLDPLRVRLGFGGTAAEKTFETFDAKAQPEAYRRAEAFLENRKSLVLQGPNGTGKTHLALAIGNALLGRYGVARIPAYFIVFDDALTQLRATYQSGYEGMGEEWYMERWRSVPVLILDEVGQTGRDKPPGDGDFTRRTAYAIIDGRYRRGNRPIILTTNKSVEELAEWITESAVDRLFEMADWVQVEGESWRSKGRRQTSSIT